MTDRITHERARDITDSLRGGCELTGADIDDLGDYIDQQDNLDSARPEPPRDARSVFVVTRKGMPNVVMYATFDPVVANLYIKDGEGRNELTVFVPREPAQAVDAPPIVAEFIRACEEGKVELEHEELEQVAAYIGMLRSRPAVVDAEVVELIRSTDDWAVGRDLNEAVPMSVAEWLGLSSALRSLVGRKA